MSLIVIAGLTLVLVGCSDGHVWWFLLPDHNHSYELFVNKMACQPKESEVIIDDGNANISGIFPGKESCAQAAVINATSFGKFAGRIDDFVCLDLYPDVIYSACITRSISDDRNECDIDDNKKHDDRSGVDGSKSSSNNHHENVLLADPSGSGEENNRSNSKPNSGLNSQFKSESESESGLRAGLRAGLEFRELSATHICIVSSGRVSITGVCRVCDIIVGDEHTLSAHLFHGNNVLYNSRGKYINGTYKGATVSTGTAKPGYQYSGCYWDTVKQDKYGNYAFITVQDGDLYASILTPHRANSFSQGNTVRNTHYKNNSNNNNRSNSDNDLFSDKWHNSEERAFLSQPYRLTSECCPFIYHCTIEAPQVEVEVQVKRSLEEGGSERMNVPYNKSTTKNAEDIDINMNQNDDHNEIDIHSKNDKRNENKDHTKTAMESRHGLNLHIIDDTTGMLKTQFLPRALYCCDSKEDDVLCVLRSMCGYDTTSTSISTSFSAVSNSGTVDKTSGDTGCKGATGSGNLNYGTHNLTDANNYSSSVRNSTSDSVRNSTSDSMRYSDSSRTGSNDSRHIAHTDIYRITSALDTAVETEKILALEIQTVDLEILQLVSLISLIESDALSTRYVNYLFFHLFVILSYTFLIFLFIIHCSL
jgi:hypothetical protein